MAGPLTHDDYLMALWYAPDPYFYDWTFWTAAPWYRPRMCRGVFRCRPAQPGDRTGVLPRRRVDHTKAFSLGLATGTYSVKGAHGTDYRDGGVGIMVRYRPVESLGIEASWQFHQATWDAVNTRKIQPTALSAQWFAFPWSVLSPYASVGVTVTRELDPDPDSSPPTDTLRAYAGLHAGIGIELAAGFQTSLSAELRSVRYVAAMTGAPEYPAAVQSRLSLDVYF